MLASLISAGNASADGGTGTEVPTPGLKLEAFRFFGDPLTILPPLASKTPDLVTVISTVEVGGTTAAWPALAAFPAPLRPRFDGASFTE